MDNNLNIRYLCSKNFGDGVNNRFWKLITKKNISNDFTKIHYITTGSIMCLINENSIVFGTGFISNTGDVGGNNFNSFEGKVYCNPKDVIMVRGPLTRDLLIKKNIYCPENYGDPLILMPCIYDKFIEINEDIIGIIPHYIDKKSTKLDHLLDNLKQSNCKFKIIDIEVYFNFEKLIDEINSCKYIISSSLHGVIMGIIYKKKTIFLEFSKNVIGNKFKFYDFFKSLSIDYNYIELYDKNILDNYINIDYSILQNLGLKILEICPFIDKERKKELVTIYNNFY